MKYRCSEHARARGVGGGDCQEQQLHRFSEQRVGLRDCRLTTGPKEGHCTALVAKLLARWVSWEVKTMVWGILRTWL